MNKTIRRCTGKEMAFAQAYRANGRIGAYAYRTVYSPNAKAQTCARLAHDVLKRQHVLDYIAQLELADAEKLKAEATANGGSLLTEEFVQKEYLRIASASLGDFLVIVPGLKKGQKPRLVLKDPALLTADHWAAIQSIKIGPDGEVEVKLHDKRGALRDIATMLCMFPSPGGAREPLLPPPLPAGMLPSPDATDPEARRRNVMQRLREKLDELAKPVVIDNETGKRVG